ncbi:lysylphosphatidylglycerol synthase transmembrane domain-containing protein [Confluentibacter lentus]|uniref:lysylphosphatidylglycerol synthase transmembrane domain-containing protein n=1 Tax=Confluentibacter lentus TaxID=1699412 RepID=UPI000C28D6D6|nr:lysylphosphatidylglycerol synthase transmembrane domain-containing protein [Confluentibacter lentus]
MNPKISKALKIILPLLLAVFLVWYSLHKVSFDKLIVFFKEADYRWIVLGMFFGFLSHLSRAYRWLFMLEPLGYKMKFNNSVMAIFSAYLINYTIPRAGEIARATIITNYEDVPFEKGFGTIVSERIADLIMMFAIIFITLFIEFDFLYSLLIEKFNPLKIVIAFVLFIFLGVLLFKYLKNSSSKMALKIRTFAKGLIEGVFSIFKMKKKWAFIFHTLFIWTMYVLMFYVTSLAFKDLGDLPLGAVLVGFIAGSFSIAATNSGIGSYPVAIYAALSIFNIPEEPSIAFGWIMWFAQTLMIIIFGGLSLIYLPIYNRKEAHKAL